MLQVPGERFGIATTVDCNAPMGCARPLRRWQGNGGRSGPQPRLHRRASRSASPIASTSAIRKSPRSSFSSAKRAAASRTRAGRSALRSRAATSRFYNESPTGAIDPTPTVGMVGLLRDVTRRAGSSFAALGDLVVIAGAPPRAISGAPPTGPRRFALSADLRRRLICGRNGPCSISWSRRSRRGSSPPRMT